MDIIELARQLGAAIQKEDAYVAYRAAKEANDADEKLQALIGEFNLQRMSLATELQKPEDQKSRSKIEARLCRLRGGRAAPKALRSGYEQRKYAEIQRGKAGHGRGFQPCNLYYRHVHRGCRSRDLRARRLLGKLFFLRRLPLI